LYVVVIKNISNANLCRIERGPFGTSYCESNFAEVFRASRVKQATEVPADGQRIMIGKGESGGPASWLAMAGARGRTLCRAVTDCRCPPRKIRNHLLLADLLTWLVIVLLVLLIFMLV